MTTVIKIAKFAFNFIKWTLFTIGVSATALAVLLVITAIRNGIGM